MGYPNSQLFIDFLIIAEIEVDGDMVFLFGALNDPLTGETVHAEFAVTFSMFYEIMTEAAIIDPECEAVIERIAEQMEKDEYEPLLFHEDPLLFHYILFRLSFEGEEEPPDEEGKFLPAGFFIEDWCYMEEGAFSFTTYVDVKDPKIKGQKSKRLERLKTGISGGLVQLALRYEYSLAVQQRGASEKKARKLADLTDDISYGLAKLADETIRGDCRIELKDEGDNED
jgi:hypothetical protein